MKKIIERIKREWLFLKILRWALPAIICKHWRKFLWDRQIERGNLVRLTVEYDMRTDKREVFYMAESPDKMPEIGEVTPKGIITSWSLDYDAR